MIAHDAHVARVWEWLAEVADPEIPVVSVVDLGIVRDVSWTSEPEGDVLHVTITPTYSGCPATRTIERDIVTALHDRGIERVRLDMRVSPPWTTDWLSATGREKLRTYGIAPPGPAVADVLDITGWSEPRVDCPRCGSGDSEMLSRFGSTPCKSLYRCRACKEPFDHFKCH